MKIQKFVLFVLLSTLLLSCSGYLQVGGTITSDNEPVKGATVKIFTKKGELLTQTTTDGDGAYNVGRKATLLSKEYRVVFEKRGYKTDTTEIQKSRGKSAVVCNHEMTKK